MAGKSAQNCQHSFRLAVIVEQTMRNGIKLVFLAFAVSVLCVPAASAQATIDVEDFLTMPMTGVVDGKGSNEVLLARVNTLREEAAGARRLFISDLNGPLYILDKESKKLSL